MVSNEAWPAMVKILNYSGIGSVFFSFFSVESNQMEIVNRINGTKSIMVMVSNIEINMTRFIFVDVDRPFVAVDCCKIIYTV